MTEVARGGQGRLVVRVLFVRDWVKEAERPGTSERAVQAEGTLRAKTQRQRVERKNPQGSLCGWECGA